jgi:SAM-dependent methyltransferase
MFVPFVTQTDTSMPDPQDREAEFDALYRANPDPYGVRSRWYEQRKIAVLMAALPPWRFRRAYEPGCGTGELTLRLSNRCDELLAGDFSAAAVAVAAERTQGVPGLRLMRHRLPEGWPSEEPPFDLIVLSEVSSFLTPAQMQAVAVSCSQSLLPGGILVACDWRPDFDGRASSVDQAHEALAALDMVQRVRHEEDDFLLQVWGG